MGESLKFDSIFGHFHSDNGSGIRDRVFEVFEIPVVI
jgi:hypothetical protein